MSGKTGKSWQKGRSRSSTSMDLKNIHPYPRFKASGVKSDCEKFLRAFQQTHSVRYEEFAKVWRERKFSFIFGGRISEKELMEFTEECLLIALSFALPPHPFQWRTGGLYLLYALYFKQPQSYKVPIRVTLENWQAIQEYIKEVKEQNHHDTHYIFRLMEMSNAFQFVAFHTEHSPVVPTSGSCGSLNPLSVNTSSVSQLVEGGFLQHLKLLQDNYIKMKSLLVTDDSVSTIRSDLCEQISASINKFEEKKVKSNTQFATGAKDYDSDDDDQYVEDNIGSTRRALKQRSLQKKASTRRSRRNRAVVMDNTSSPTKSPSRTKIRRRRRRTSGKSYTSDSGDGEDQEEMGENSGSTQILSMPILGSVKLEDSSHDTS